MTVPQDPFPRVSTRDHFGVTWLNGEELLDGHGATDYEFEDGPVPGWSGASPDELLIHVHGFMLDDASAVEHSQTMQGSLRDEGYTHPVIGYSWDSNWNPNRWWSTVRIADRNGQKLAKFVEDYRSRNPNTRIRITAHSLGAQVTVSALESLCDDHGAESVRSVSFLGGAVRAKDLASDGRYGDAVEDGTDRLDNFYSGNDGVLKGAFGWAELNSAVGLVGISGTSPPNYQDHDVSSRVNSHFDYVEPDRGCIDQVVPELG